ncbi:MAG: hypothetical protein GY870_21600, partial [archaeon]|nr:hypothetical protein [archaeon]
MSRNKKIYFLITGFLLIIISITFILQDSPSIYLNQEDPDNLCTSATVEGMNDILITNISRQVELNGYGVVNIEDSLEITNNYDNPITSIYIGIPTSYSDNLIYYKAVKDDGTSSLLVERSSYVSEGCEMIAIYFDSPLLPGQVRSIIFIQSFMDMLLYYYPDGYQRIHFVSPIYPILPYRA